MPDRSHSLKIFFSVGEPSGDVHAANLIRQLQSRCPQVHAVGFGGPHMARAGCHLMYDLTTLAVMWFGRVLLNIATFWRLYRKAARYFETHRPDAVVLVDYPGFNWWIAKAAKRRGIPVYYYMPPQIWAWARWRIGKMRRWVDHVLCGLPFEAQWFAQRGCRTEFVGHPFFDETCRHEGDPVFLAEQRRKQGPLVVVLPGSRNQEVTGNLDVFLAACRKVYQAVPNVRFAVACFKPLHADYARPRAAATGLPIEVFCRKTPELIQLADCCVAVSGSVSLELLYHLKPTVIHYRVSRLAFFVQGFFRKVKYITLVNLLAGDALAEDDLSLYDPNSPDAAEVLFPEYLTCEDKSTEVAAHIIGWLQDRKGHSELVERLQQLKDRVAHGGASARAAEYLLSTLQSAPVSGPHWRRPTEGEAAAEVDAAAA